MTDLGTVGIKLASGTRTQGRRAVSAECLFRSDTRDCIEARWSGNAGNVIMKVSHIVPMNYAPMGLDLTLFLYGGCGAQRTEEIDDCEHFEKYDQVLLSMC